MMAKDFFDSPRNPVNKTAAIVLNAKGVDYKPEMKPNYPLWEVPPETYEVPKSIEDLTGFRNGRTTVVGFLGYKGKNKHWLVKCACGNYEPRNARSLYKAKRRGKTQGETEDACQYCRHIQFLQREERKKFDPEHIRFLDTKPQKR